MTRDKYVGTLTRWKRVYKGLSQDISHQKRELRKPTNNLESVKRLQSDLDSMRAAAHMMMLGRTLWKIQGDIELQNNGYSD